MGANLPPCKQTTPKAPNHPPTAPDHTPMTTAERIKLSYNLFENEDGSDVILMVGDESYRERVPAHSWVLAASNQYFRAMFQGPLADRHKKTYEIPNDPKGFQNLLKWLYRQECGIQSIDSALITLQVAIQYLCPELAEQCVEYIGKHLTVSNVLKVLKYTWRYCPSCPDQGAVTIEPSMAPSAPSLEAIEGPSRLSVNNYSVGDQRASQQLEPSQHTVHSMTQLQEVMEDSEFQDPTACCSDLFNVCLDAVDKATQAVLETEFLEELDVHTLHLILRRSSLNVQNELRVFQALQRWSTAECKRRMLPLTSENRRAVLGKVLYHVRFLCMNNDQLQQTSSLLTADEFNYFATRISGHNPLKIPPTLCPYLEMMATPRCHKPGGLFQPGSNMDKNKKKSNSGKKKYTKKELVLDVVSCLAVLFD